MKRGSALAQIHRALPTYAPYVLPGLAGLLVLILAVEWIGPGTGDAGSVPPPALPSATAQTANVTVSQWGSDIIARPLFSPSRRSDASAGDDDGGLPRLSAIIVTGHAGTAIFAADGQKPQSIGVGGEIDGDKLLRVDPDEVELLGPSGPLILRPQFAPPGAGAAADASTAPAPGPAPAFNPMTPLPPATPTSNPTLYIEQNF
ncbi:MAG TPA: hypothetical protein VEQ16_02435 [Acidocella sp.]|jgi:hypothetical protein|nr:hypothetical protein [Acidocella sp.]